MLAGASPFRRATMADTISAILKEEAPDLTTRGEISPALDRIVRHCLEKEASKRFHSAHDLAFALEALPEARETVSFVRPVLTISRRHALTTLGVSAVAAAGAYVWGTGRAGVIDTAPLPTRSDIYTVHQLTESVGLDEFPALSPDGQYLAFTASVAARRQLFVRHLTGGSTPQLTTEAADHQFPRWMPDSSGLVYLSSVPMPLAAGVSSDISRADAEGQGSIRLVPTLGGTPRAIASAISGADINSNGRLVYFRLMGGTIQLVTASLDGTDVDVVLKSTNEYHRHPRWSTDGNAIAFQRGDGLRDDIFVLALETGQLNRLTEDRTIINGLTWLPDGKGLVYSSSRGSSMPYLPQMSLWRIGLDASAKRLTSGEVSYEHPDVSSSGRLVAARRSMQFDVWKFPFGAKASENMDGRIQLTRQTSQVMTPTSGPRGEVAFLSDSGGHANIWVLPSRTEEPKQVTFEEDRTVAVGVPVWSPDGRWIAFVSSRGRTGFDFGIWLVDPSGETRPWNIVPAGLGLAWSPDSQWIYYADGSAGALHKVSVKGGTPSLVSAERTRNVIGKHGDTLYLLVADQLVTGRAEYQIRAASPEGTPSRLIATLPASRVPTWQVVNPVLSPDGEWMAMPLTDGFTTNVWALHIRSGAWRPVTDFGDRVTFIARRVSWSDGGTSILASVGYGDADVFALENL
jgi:Tol biopolymer transport system component